MATFNTFNIGEYTHCDYDIYSAMVKFTAKSIRYYRSGQKFQSQENYTIKKFLGLD